MTGGWRFSCLLTVVAAFAGLTALGGGALAETSRMIKFKAYRNGSEFGFSTVKIDGPSGEEKVEVVTAFRVGLGPFTAFKYLLRTSTQWRGGRIERLDSVINDDGDVFRAKARRGDGGLAVDGFDGPLTAAADILPTTYWRADMVTRSTLLSTQHGRVLKVGFQNLGEETVTTEGREVSATHHAMRGDLDIDIWYDAQGDWVKLMFTVGDSDIEYKRVTPSERDLDAFVALETVADVSGADVHALIEPQ
ncbi:MAG: DUF6134 family protein [Alphaproteobacteria bacterium]|nr:DUF6134 family protein [Alphaproteobacteria bacterium]